MLHTDLFYIDQNQCNGCLLCVRRCQVDAIRFLDRKAEIRQEKCVECGDCYRLCPVGAIRFKSSVVRARQLIKENDVIVASLSPQWLVEFPGIGMERMVEALRLLGFTHVSQREIAAEAVRQETVRHRAASGGRLTISTVCPAIVSTVRRYYPGLVSYLSPVADPLTVHARMIRSWYGEEAKVVSIDSCMAVADHEETDLLVTFDELREWFREEKVNFDDIPGNRSYAFEPVIASGGGGYIRPGGLLDDATIANKLPEESFQRVGCSGLNRVRDLLDGITYGECQENTFLELMSCKGGCLAGPGSLLSSGSGSMLSRRLAFSRQTGKRGDRIDPSRFPSVRMQIPREENEVYQEPAISTNQIDDLLASLQIARNGVLPNCSGCGYRSCRDFARGVIEGMAEEYNCVWYLRNTLRDNISAMVGNLPYAVFIVTDDLKFIEANQIFYDMLCMRRGADLALINSDIEHFVPFARRIGKFFETKTEYEEKDIRVKGKMLRLTLFSLASKELACGVLRNMFTMDVRNEDFVNRTRAIMNENFDTVQKIAYLLGENASRTEAMLNSLIELQDDSSENS